MNSKEKNQMIFFITKHLEHGDQKAIADAINMKRKRVYDIIAKRVDGDDDLLVIFNEMCKIIKRREDLMKAARRNLQFAKSMGQKKSTKRAASGAA